ncbi:ABC transporter permease [Radicibacter daui]|uniref:ABC transporter permease n=1 Tax=Radicibacter daui TaxID=3064829 RepID=UPI004046AEE5
MFLDTTGAIIAATIIAATPLLLAAIGELVTEKSGVLNLGVEGMMLVGAVAGFAVDSAGGGAFGGLIAAMLAGAAMAALFGFLTLFLLTNQVATGLALTMFGTGLSALAGQGFVGTTVPRLGKIDIPLLSQIPLLGPAFFSHDALVYGSVLITAAVWYFLYRTRGGLILRAMGESADVAHAIGYPVIGIRFAAVLFGGAMAGLGGAYLSLAYTPLWAENMTAGRGWVALALVVFATWRPWRAMLGAYIFGGVTIAQLHVQGMGVSIPPQLLSMLPYAATIVVLVIISRDATRVKLNAPAALGKPFLPTA